MSGLIVNLGCGRDVREGMTNVDCVALPGVDHVVDLDQPDKVLLPFAPDTVDQWVVSHLIEHIHHPLPLLEAMWHASRPGATAHFACPYGYSDDADEDPTHVRRMLVGSWGYFSAPAFWRADYGYRGDWQVHHINLLVSYDIAKGRSAEAVLELVNTSRNIVSEMQAILTAVKPAREPRRELHSPPQIKVVVCDA